MFVYLFVTPSLMIGLSDRKADNIINICKVQG